MTVETLGVMLLGSGSKPPRKLARAIETVARDLHPCFAAQPWIRPGISHESCVLCSLTVRDFFRRIGMAGAEVAPVMMTIRAFDPSGEQIHSLGAGVPGGVKSTDERWNGHMVVTVGGWLIDPTMGRMRRPQWEWLQETAVAPLWTKRTIVQGWRVLAGCGVDYANNGNVVEIAWHALDARDDRHWATGPDTQEWRRIEVREMLVERYEAAKAKGA